MNEFVFFWASQETWASHCDVFHVPHRSRNRCAFTRSQFLFLFVSQERSTLRSEVCTFLLIYGNIRFNVAVKRYSVLQHDKTNEKLRILCAVSATRLHHIPPPKNLFWRSDIAEHMPARLPSCRASGVPITAIYEPVQRITSSKRLFHSNSETRPDQEQWAVSNACPIPNCI